MEYAVLSRIFKNNHGDDARNVKDSSQLYSGATEQPCGRYMSAEVTK